MGFGLGSASMIENVRFHNIRDFNSYVNFFEDSGGSASRAYNEEKMPHITPWEACPIREEVQHLTVEEQMEEFVFLGFRMTRGISTGEFAKNFGKTIDEVYPGSVDKYVAKELLRRQRAGEDERIALTRDGINVSNYIMAEFLLSC